MTASEAERNEQLFQQRGFHRRMGYGQSPALVVIDMQKGFTNPQTALGSNLDAQIEATQPLLEVAHEQSLFDLDAKYADVTSLPDTLDYMRSVGHNAKA
jgi:hypothetical protein